MSFSQRLRLLREECQYSQPQVASACQISYRIYQYYEAGEREPSLSKLVALADFFDVSLDWLTGRSEVRDYTRSDEKIR